MRYARRSSLVRSTPRDNDYEKASTQVEAFLLGRAFVSYGAIHTSRSNLVPHLRTPFPACIGPARGLSPSEDALLRCLSRQGDVLRRGRATDCRVSPSEHAMTEDYENWAIALQIKRWQGMRAPVYIAEQLGAAAIRGDHAGIARWQAIAATFDTLRKGTQQ